MFCESCGSQVPDGQSFCSNCGAPVVQAAPQPAAQPAQPVYQQPVAQPVQPVVQVQPVVVQAAQPAPAAKSSGLAIAGLIMGIFTLIFCWVPVVGFILGVLGLIFSIAGIAKKNGGAKGAAIAGLIMTIIGAIISVVLTVHRGRSRLIISRFDPFRVVPSFTLCGNPFLWKKSLFFYVRM